MDRVVEDVVMEFARTEDGKIVERWVQSDVLSPLQQLDDVELPGA